MLALSPSDDADSRPRLAEGVRLLGAYDSQGLTKPKFIAQRPDGQVVLLSELLYITARNLDGSPLDRVATQVSEQSGRDLGVLEVRYLVDKKLVPLSLVAVPAQAVAEAPKAAPILAMAGKPFVPAPLVRVLAWGLRPLFWPPVIALTLLVTVVVDVWAFETQGVLGAMQQTLLHPLQMLGAFALLASATLFHELGHATACRYGKGRPGVIGAGVYLMFPAFYTDVTDSYRLSRRARLRVDLGGVYFNTVWIVAAAVAYSYWPYPPLLLILAFSNLVIVQQLLPVVRFDGYWVLSDLIGVPDLFARIKPALKSLVKRGTTSDLTPKARAIVAAWVAVVIPALLASSVLTLSRLPGLAVHTYHAVRADVLTAGTELFHHQWAPGALTALTMVFLLLPVVGFGVVITRSSAAVVGLVRGRRPPPRHMLTKEEERHLDALACLGLAQGYELRPPRRPYDPLEDILVYEEPVRTRATFGSGWRHR